MLVFSDKTQASPFVSGMYCAARLGNNQICIRCSADYKIRTTAPCLRTAYPMAIEHPVVLSHRASRCSTNKVRSSSQAIPPWRLHPSNEKNGHAGAYCYLVMQHCTHFSSQVKRSINLSHTINSLECHASLTIA